MHHWKFVNIHVVDLIMTVSQQNPKLKSRITKRAFWSLKVEITACVHRIKSSRIKTWSKYQEVSVGDRHDCQEGKWFCTVSHVPQGLQPITKF